MIPELLSLVGMLGEGVEVPPAETGGGGTRTKTKRPPNWGKKEFWEPNPLPKKKRKPQPVEVRPEVGIIATVGYAPTVEVTGHVTIEPAPAVEMFTGFHPTVHIDISEEHLIRAAFALLDY